MNDDPLDSSATPDAIDVLVAEYLDALDHGQAPSRSDWLAQHPEHAAELARFLDDLERLSPAARMGKAVETQSRPGSGAARQAPAGDSETTSDAPGASRNDTQELPCNGSFGDYELLQTIARGGMGVVFKARHRQLDRVVALKMILAGPFADEQHLQRFRVEAQAAAKLDHPGIVPVYEVGNEQGLPYFAMAFVEGASLAERLRDGPLPPQEAAGLVRALAAAVAYAHQQGIVHRDLKPGNVLLDAQGQPKLTDFGLAKQTRGGNAMTGTGQILGTPSYMAPEQARGAAVGPAADVYGLGALLFALLTGRPPFQGSSPLETMQHVMTAEPPKPRSLNPSVPRDLETICLKCLHKAPEKRYVSAAQLGADLRRFQDGEPIEARPAGWAERGWKWAKRRPTTAALMLVSGVALLVLLVGGLWFNARLTEQRNEALGQKKTAEEKTKLAETEKTRAETQLRRAEWLVYAGQLARAQSAFENNDAALALQLLEECQWDLRGWEHRHLWTRLSSKATLVGHTRRVSSVAFSPDGRRILTGSYDQTAKVWDADKGQELFSLVGPTEPVNSVTFSPNGRRLLTGSWDGTAKVWDADKGQEIFTLKGHTDWVTSVAFSPDGRLVLTGSGDKTAKVWDADKGQELFSLKGHTEGVWSVAFSSDGRRILTGSGDKTAKVWDADKGQELFSLKGHTQPVSSVAFSPEGRRILTGSGRPIGREPGEVKVWDANKGQELFSLKGHTEGVFSVAFSPDGLRILTGSGGFDAQDRILPGEVKVWDADKRQELFSLKGHTGDVSSIAFSPDGRLVLTGSSDHTAKVWDADKGQGFFSLKGQTHPVTSVAFSPDGQRILTGNGDGRAKVWDANKGQELFSLKGHRDIVTSVAFSPDGQRILTGSDDQMAKVWDANEGQELFSLEGHTGFVTSVAFSPDGRRLLTGSSDQTAKVWDADKGQELFSLKGHKGSVSSVAFSPDSRRILTGSADGTAKVWDADKGQEIFTLKGHTDWVTSVAFSPDGRLVLTGSGDKTAKVWDADKGQELFSLKGHTEGVWSVAFSSDSRRILTGSGDKTAKVWDAHTGQELFSLKGHTHRVTSVAFSPVGRRILTGSSDTTAKVWEADKGQDVLSLKGHTDLVSSVAFSPDGRRVIAQDQQGKILAWDTTTGHLLPDPPALMPAAARQATSPDGHLLVRIQNGAALVERLTDRPRDEYPDRAALERLARFDPDFHTTRLAEAENADDDFAAAFHLGHLLRHQPWAADLLVKQAHVFARQGQPQQAALSLTRALLLNPRVAFADPGFASRGDHAARAGNWPSVVAILRILVEQPGASPLLRSNLLLAELAAGGAEAARRTAGAIVAALPDQADAAVAAGLQSWLSAAPLSEADAAKWEQHVRQAVLRQRNALTLHTHGVALYRAGKHEEAGRVLAESVKASGGEGPAETWLFQALAAQKQGQHAEALGLLARYELWHQKQTFPYWQLRTLHQLLLAEAQREVNAKPANSPMRR